MKKKFFTKKKIIIVVILVAIIIFVARQCSKVSELVSYIEETAQVRDITTYLEFSGKVEAVDNVKMFSTVSAKVLEVKVEEGDYVKKGDIIAVLDASDAQYNVDLQEKNLEQAKLQSEYNIKDATTSLNNLQTQLDQGLNSQINMAQKSLLAAQDQYVAAVEAYNKAKTDFEARESSAIVSARRLVSNAQYAYDQAKKQADALYKSGSEDWNTYMRTSTVNLTNAQEDYESTIESLDENVASLRKNMLSAENSFYDAKRDYDTTLLAMEQNVKTYSDSLEKIKALSNNEASQMQIDHLKEGLDDYIIYASKDGYITTLDITDGDTVLANQTPVASITNLERMKANINIDEYDIAQVHEDDKVDIYISALDKHYDGVITKISKIAKAQGNVSYLTATVEFDADESIISGLSAEIKLIKANELGVVALPISSVSYDTDNTAYVLKKGTDGKENKTVVTTGVSDGTYVQIVDGVKEGDVILRTPSIDDYTKLMMEQSGRNK